MAAANKSMKLESHSPWPNLPDDVVSLIVNRLYYVDQIRFRAVCKSWRDAKIKVLKSADKLPWNMAIDTVSGSCSLYDPSHKRKYAIKTSRIFVKATVLASKHGWVILAEKTDYKNAQIFFYNPFTDQVIQLPDLELSSTDQAIFTTTPVSPDCEIFVVSSLVYEFYIRMCRPGAATWTQYRKSPRIDINYDSDDEDIECGFFPATEYVDGVIYCAHSRVAVAAFDVALNGWKIYPYPEAYGYILETHLIESDGNLVLCHDGSVKNSEEYNVFRLDQSKKNWNKMDNLGNRSLFLGICTAFSMAVDETSELANTVHPSWCRCSSLCKAISFSKGVVTFWFQLPPPQLR